MSKRLLVVAGLKREAALLAGQDLTIILSGGHRPTLDNRLASVYPDPIDAVVSFGLAGALDPALPIGAAVVPDRIAPRTSDQGTALDKGLADALRSSLLAIGLETTTGALLGVDAPLLTAAEKAEARLRTGTVAVDMESHVAAAWAARHGKRFAALRVISDGAERDMPPIVGSVMRPDGGIHSGRLAAGLLRDPRQIAGLIRTGRDFGRACRVLRRVGSVLGDGRLIGGDFGRGSGGLLGLDLR